MGNSACRWCMRRRRKAEMPTSLPFSLPTSEEARAEWLRKGSLLVLQQNHLVKKGQPSACHDVRHLPGLKAPGNVFCCRPHTSAPVAPPTHFCMLYQLGSWLYMLSSSSEETLPQTILIQVVHSSLAASVEEEKVRGDMRVAVRASDGKARKQMWGRTHKGWFHTR